MCIDVTTEAPRPGRRADSKAGSYTPVNPQFVGGGITKCCATCNQFKAMGLGWKKLRKGLSCPQCAQK